MLIYLDEILVVSTTMEEHITHVKKVLCCLDEAGLRLKPSNCNFTQKEIEYLRFTLSAEGVKPDIVKILAVQEFHSQCVVSLLNSFLILLIFIGDIFLT